MKVSIVIPTYNEEKDIEECIKSIKGQSYKNFEIIVVDDGSKDKTLDVVKKFRDVKIIMGEHKGPGFSRNLGARKATGEILIFIDADMTFDKDYLKNLIAPILEDKTGEVVGSTHELEIVENTKNIWSRCWGRIRVSKEEAKKIRIFRAILRKKFLELGGFDSSYGYADDQTFWFKYQIKPVVAKDTICYHKNPETLKSVYKQSRWIGASAMNWWINTPGINWLAIFLLIILSPLMIILVSIKKCQRNKDWAIFLYMLVFITARYFGNISGYIQRLVWKKNFK